MSLIDMNNRYENMAMTQPEPWPAEEPVRVSAKTQTARNLADLLQSHGISDARALVASCERRGLCRKSVKG